MRKIKIFIGSSIDELHDDRVAIGNFFRQLNDIYLERGLYFQLIMCEDYDDAIELEGKQSRYDKEIEDSELSIFIFYKKVGIYTEHEFEIAYSHFKSELRPKILTVFKCINDASEIVESAKHFANRLDKEYKHYYKTYTNTDSLKLWLIMQIKSMGLDQDIVEFSGGKVVINGEPVATYSNAPAFSEHTELKEKKVRYAELKNECVRLKAAYIENSDDIEAYVAYSKAAKEKNDLEAAITESENKIVEQLQSIYTITERGGLSERQVVGYRLIDAGKYDEALQILDKDEIFGDIAASERTLDYGQKIVENAKADLQTSVNELKQRIETLTLKGVNTESENEIISLYIKVCELSGKYGFALEPYLDFADFCYKQGKSQLGYDTLIDAKEIFDKSKDFDTKSNYLRMLALVASGAGKKNEAFEYQKQALKIIEGLLMIEETDERLEICAKIHHSMYFSYGYQSAIGREHALEAHKIFSLLVTRDYKKYSLCLAKCEGILSIGAEPEEELSRKKRVIELYKVRVDAADASDSEKSGYALAVKQYCDTVVKNDGDFAPNTDIRTMMDDALKIAKEISEKNPSAYDRIYATMMCGYGNMLVKGASNEDASYYLKTGCDVYDRLYTMTPTNYAYLSALASERLAEYYLGKGNPDFAMYYMAAARLYEERGDDTEIANRSRAGSYYDAAMIHIRRFAAYEDAARCVKKSLELYESLEEPHEKDKQWIGWLREDIKTYGLDKYFK